MASARADRKMHQINNQMFQLEFNHQPFHPRVKEMKGLVANSVAGEKGIPLVFEHRDPAPERALTVLDRMAMVVAKRSGELFALVDTAGTVGAAIDLDKANQIGFQLTQKGADPLEVFLRGVHGALHLRTGAVADVVENEAHGFSFT